MIRNAKQLPKVYYGRHMAPGVAEYRNKDGSYRILINEATCKAMDPTFQGRPLFVLHVDEVDLKTIERDADGWVVESFYNAADGQHWSKFMAVTDDAHDAIQKKWKLSNAYHVKKSGAGGRWHDVEYAKEVLEGEYEHLALVPNPRYEESVILTPEEFKQYNARKLAELETLRLANSKDKPKGEPKMKVFAKLFNRSSVDAAEAEKLAGLSIELPKSKREVTFETLVNEADSTESARVANAAAEARGEFPVANENHVVEVGGEKMIVKALVTKYDELVANAKKMNEDEKEEEKKDKKENEGDEDEKEKKDKKINDEEDGDEDDKKMSSKKKNSKEESDEKKKNFDKLDNARDNAVENSITVETAQDGAARGRARYGSEA